MSSTTEQAPAKIALARQVEAVEAAAPAPGHEAGLAAAGRTLRLFLKHEKAVRTVLSVQEFITTPRPKADGDAA